MKKSSQCPLFGCVHIQANPQDTTLLRFQAIENAGNTHLYSNIFWMNPLTHFSKVNTASGFLLALKQYKQGSIVSSQNLEDCPSSCTTDLFHKKNYRHPWPQRHTSAYGTFWNKKLCCFSCIRTNLDVKHFFAFPCIFANMTFSIIFFT